MISDVQFSQDGQFLAFSANSGGFAVYDLVKNTLQGFAPPLPNTWLDGKAEIEQDYKHFWASCKFKWLPKTEDNSHELVTRLPLGWNGPIKEVRVWKFRN